MKSFSDWIGHQRIVRSLQKAIEKEQISHAYLFEGPEGMGKAEMAKLFAKTLQCEEKGIEPCNVCASCVQMDSGNHPDIKWVAPAINDKSFKIDIIRKEIEEDITQKPYLYERKIYILSEAEKMTVQAQNALLKTLEEPPEYGIIIILASSVQNFLATILSRTVNIKFHPYTPQEMKRYLQKAAPGTSLEFHELVVAFSEGNPGKAMKFLNSERWKELRNFSISMIQKIQNTPKNELSFLYGEWEAFQQETNMILEFFLLWYRDVLLVQELGEKAVIFNKDVYQDIAQMARKEKMTSMYGKIKAIQQTAKNLIYYNANYQLSIEMLLLQLK